MVDKQDDKRGGSEDTRDYRDRGRAMADYITTDQAKKISEDVTKEKLEFLFTRLGIDINNFTELKKFYDDFDYVRKSREANLERKSTFSKSLITTAVGAVLGLVAPLIVWILTHPR